MTFQSTVYNMYARTYERRNLVTPHFHEITQNSFELNSENSFKKHTPTERLKNTDQLATIHCLTDWHQLCSNTRLTFTPHFSCKKEISLWLDKHPIYISSQSQLTLPICEMLWNTRTPWVTSTGSSWHHRSSSCPVYVPQRCPHYSHLSQTHSFRSLPWQILRSFNKRTNASRSKASFLFLSKLLLVSPTFHRKEDELRFKIKKEHYIALQ